MPGYGKVRLPKGFINLFWKTVKLVNARFLGVARAVESLMKKSWEITLPYQHEKMFTALIVRTKTMEQAGEQIWSDNVRIATNMAYLGSSRAVFEKQKWMVSVLGMIDICHNT
jgi:hypothetical protein